MSIRGSLRYVLLLALVCAPCTTALAALHHPGKWTNPVQWRKSFGQADSFYRETAVNMALLALPDSAGHTQARVLWFQDDHEHVPGQHTAYGGYLDWRAPSDSLLGSGAFPDTSSTSGTLRARRYPSPQYNIFCSGMAQMIEDQGYGRLLVAGGTLEAENGSTEARIYDARTNSWETTANTLAVGRWYPTLTTLPTGKTLVTSGSRFREMWLTGGASADSLVHRDPVSHGTSWLSSVLPEQSTQLAPPRRMGPRRGHTATWSLGGSQIIFGGLDVNSGNLVDQFWQLGVDPNAGASDYAFRWQRRTPLTSGPTPRAYHAAAVIPKANSPMLDDALAVLAGDTTGTGAPSRTVWLGTLKDNSWSVNWEKLAPTFDSDPFPARFGHTAYWHDDFSCLFVYGGTSGLGAAPSDPNVYSFEFVDNGASDSVRIKRCTLQAGSVVPMPRAYFAAGLVERDIPNALQNPSGNLAARGLLVFGGRTGTGATAISDSLYVLWPLDSVTVRWQRVPQQAMPGSSRPPALEFASGTGTTNSIEFWLAGGLDAQGAAHSEVWSFRAHCQPCGPDSLVAEWEARPPVSHAVWGHAMPVRTQETFARTPEIFDPGSKAFTHYPGAYRLQDWYPHTFVMPGSGAGVAVTTGPDTLVWKLDASTATWSQLGGATASFRGGAAVMYTPGRIMKCGSRDTDGVGGVAVGTTATLDLNAASPAWAASDTMQGRVNHNLTMLPDGKVLVTGGMGWRDNQRNVWPRRRPELWDPAGNGGSGAWEGGDGVGTQLDTSLVARNYHSTALLLPDGRVLCAGGNGTDRPGQSWPNDQFRVDLYSPPYLFNADGTGAIRPDLRTAPRRVSYGQPFVVSVGGGDAIAGGCLIRAGAATHGYDQSQLYLPLTFTQVGPIGTSTRYYRTAAPADSALAPPGDYLLFVRNGQGTPSIARWVRISRTNSGTGVPTTVTDLGRECINGTAVRLRWTPPGSDVGDTVLVRVSKYQIKYGTDSIATVQAFRDLPDSLPPPAIGEPLGDPDRVDTPALSVGQTYYFRLRAKNAASADGNWSALSNPFIWTVHDEECGGSGGGGGGGGYYEGASIRPGGASAFSTFPRGSGTAPSDSSYLENTLLPNAPVGVSKRDLVRLPFGPRWSESGASVRLSRGGTRATQFDRVRLMAVDVAPGERAFVRGAAPAGGLTHDPARVMHADGRDLTEAFLSGGAFDGRDGDTLYADLGADGAGVVALWSRHAQLVRAPDRTGIEIACPAPAGWAQAGHHEVREQTSDELFEVPDLRHVRLVFRGRHRLEGLMRFTPGGPLAVTTFEPAAAGHSRLGDVAAGLAAGEGVTLAPGDQLVASFAATPTADGVTRAWFLEVTGAHLATAGGAQVAKRSGADGAAAPAVFALSRNRPNPFTGTTTFGFDVPRRSHVRLEVFDVLGRRVAALANREYEPGRFTLEWDGRTSSGSDAPAGVYLCRMSAGAFRKELHVVRIR